MFANLVRLALPLLCAGLLPAQARYRIGTDPWMAWAPLWVAQEKGLWKQQGIDVEVVGYASGDTNRAFAAGKVDFATVMAGSAVGMRVAEGVEAVVIAEIDWSHGGDKILVPKGKRLADCKAQRIGIYEDSPAVRMFLGAKLKADGLRESDFEIVVLEDLESMASQFAAGRLAAAVTYEPYAEQATAQGGCAVVATTADFPGVMPECFVALRSRLDAIPVAHTAALLRGWIAAVEWAQDPKNGAEFARICVEKAFGDEKVEAAGIPAMLANVRIHGRTELRARNLGKDGIAAFLTECLGFATARAGQPPVPAAAMLDLRALERALGPAAAPR